MYKSYTKQNDDKQCIYTKNFTLVAVMATKSYVI